MRVCIEIFFSLLFLNYSAVVENSGTVSVNFYKFNTYGEDASGGSCDGWFGGSCEAYFYLKYRQCYNSFYSCGSYTTNYYYSGGNWGTMNRVYYYRTSNSFSGRFIVRMEGWDDDWNADDHLGTAEWHITRYSASSTWTTLVYRFSHGTYYEIKYRFQCNSYYYGNLCNKYCKARNDVYGHYSCSSSGSKRCLSGWVGSSCNIDKNECTSGAHICNLVTSYCSNIGNGGWYTCICNTGYIKSGTSCVDYNECYYNTDGCAQRCTNSYGSYICSCYTGYSVDSSDSRACNDINECNQTPNVCSQECTNTAGSYTCSCYTGYSVDSSDSRACNDINECNQTPNVCSQECTNTAGSYTCSCYTGYSVDSSDSRACNDINECNQTPNVCSQECTNTAGSYNCSCYTGYSVDSSDSRACNDINECNQTPNVCSQECTNTAGSYTCSCYTGYSVDSSDSRACNDINECNQTPGVCSQECTNTAGSYTCSCYTGYRLDFDGDTCNDINECAENTNLCQSPKKCVNQPGTYKCDCLPGYQKLQNPERCEDINECTAGTDLCEQTCTNTVGSYGCSCNTNYYLSSSYACDIVTFTASISLYSYGSTYARFRVSKQFHPTTSSVSVTNQIHALDLRFGNGIYAVNSPTTRSYQTSLGLKPYRLYRFYVTTTGTLYSDDSNYYTLRTSTSTPSAPPQNVRVTAFTSNSLRIEWAAPPSPDRNGIITGYTLQYKKSSASSYSTISSLTVTLASLTSLNEFTEYQVRVAAATSRGIGPFSDIVVTTTEEAAPVSPPQIAVTGVAAYSITISLTPPAVDRINGELTQYQVVYYGESIDQTVKTIDIQPNTNSINNVNYQLTQLEENVVYRIKARICTSIGSGPYSVHTIQITLPSAPSGAPSNLVFNSIQTTSLSLSWNPPPIREWNSDTIAYRVQYYGNVDTSVRNITTPNMNLVLSGLKEGEVYKVVVCSYNSEGHGPCEAIEQQTQEDLPTGCPQSVNVTALNDTAIIIFWNPLLADQANGAIISYEVSVNGTQHDSQTHLYSTNETFICVINLEEFERYLVQMRAINSIGAGPYSNTVEVRTHQDVPAGAPRDLQGTANKVSILLTWNPPVAADINGVITTYDVHYVGTFEDTSNRTVIVGNVTQYNLEQLVLGEIYRIQVRACTSVGPGPYCNWIKID